MPRRRWSSIHARLATLDAPGGQVVYAVLVDGARHRLGGVLLGVVEAARPRREGSHDAWPGGPELLGWSDARPMVAAVQQGGISS